MEYGVDLLYQDLVYHFQFDYVSHEVWSDERACGHIFGRLYIFRVAVIPYKTICQCDRVVWLNIQNGPQMLPLL